MVVISYRERNCKFLSGEVFTYKSKLYRGGRCCVMRFVRLTLLTGRTFSRGNDDLFKKKKKPRFLSKWNSNWKKAYQISSKNESLFLSREHRTDVTASCIVRYTYHRCISPIPNRKKTCTRGNVARTLFRTYSKKLKIRYLFAIEWTRLATTTTRLRLLVITAKTDTTRN